MPGEFSDPAVVASYVTRANRTVPGLPLLHQLVDQILGECVPGGGRVLVVGAGGGLETRYLAERHAGWRFDGVDPSKPMLDLARETLGELADRVELIAGGAASAPDGPFDAATCLLTLHFLPEAERLETLREIHRRLRPGALLVTCQISVPGGERRGPALERFMRHANPDPDAAAVAARSLAGQLPLLTPEEDAAMLAEAGFSEIELYYAALGLRGWAARA